MKTQDNPSCTHRLLHLDPFLRQILFLALLASLLIPAVSAFARTSPANPNQSEVTAFDLIVAMNTLRVSYGHPALIEDPIIDAVAQTTAETMAANHMATHIGNVSGRLAAAGYGGGAKVWGTENIALGHFSIDGIMSVWSDEAHMLPVVIPAYCNAGAGVAKSSDGTPYYVFQAAYISGKACGEYTSQGGSTTNPSGTTIDGRAGGVSQLIVPVKIATPDAEGKIYHIVQAGQSFWSIAAAYKITIRDIEIWNNLSQNSPLLIGQKLFIPGPNTKGYATPTPVGIVHTVMPDLDGKIVHAVQPYQTLSTIALAYGVTVERLLALNGIQIDAPLQIGQKLIIRPSQITPSPTPRPLTPIEKLTPASDGKYYHTVKSGENLSWIADLYKVRLNDLMSWNGLTMSSVLQPNQKLLLQVTPPANITPTPGLATATPTAKLASATITSIRLPTRTSTLLTSSTPTAMTETPDRNIPSTWIILIGLAAAGIIFAVLISRRK
jgi:LysM repeat protein